MHVVGVGFAFGADRFRFFSVVSSIGAPIDITAQGLRLEAFSPGDGEMRQA